MAEKTQEGQMTGREFYSEGQYILISTKKNHKYIQKTENTRENAIMLKKV